MSIVIRPFRMSDYDEAFAIWQSTDGMGLDLDGPDSRAGVRSYLRRNPGMSFMASDGRSLVGAVLCGHDGRRGYLHHLAVLPAFRSKGIGRKPVASCLRALAANGTGRCNISILPGNAAGTRFWKAMGWNQFPGLTLMYMQTSGR